MPTIGTVEQRYLGDVCKQKVDGCKCKFLVIEGIENKQADKRDCSAMTLATRCVKGLTTYPTVNASERIATAIRLWDRMAQKRLPNR
jgi:hypothetical protein